MHTEYHKWYSSNLGQDMEVKVYGHFGKPMLVFPCAGGSFHEFEDLGMLRVVAPYINDGRVKVFCVDSVDNQSWLNQGIWPGDRARRHNAYDRYLTHEVVPFIYNKLGGVWGIMTSGCSMGAFHAVNYQLRHPDIVDATIALSGIYSMNDYVGRGDADVHFNSPIESLAGLNDEWFLSRLRGSKMMLGVGQGAWEDECLRDTCKLRDVLHSKGIPAWVDVWGHDVNHDWPWWYKMMPHFLNHQV